MTAFGAGPAPTHTSGTVSDGSLDWTWLNGDTVTLDANENVAIACRSYGNGVLDWEHEGDGQLLAVGAVGAETLGLTPAVQTVPATTKIQVGAARGENAVDHQRVRTSATHVASGAAATIGGGQSNRASQSHTTVAGGNANTASGTGSTVGGGRENTASGVDACVPGGHYGSSGGIAGKLAYASGTTHGSIGSAQLGELVLLASTTDATPAVMTSGTSRTPSATNILALPDASVFDVRGRVVCRDQGGNCAKWTIEATVKRGSGAGTTALVGSATVTQVHADADAVSSGYAVAVSADTTLGGFSITVTGAASKTIKWTARLSTVETA